MRPSNLVAVASHEEATEFVTMIDSELSASPIDGVVHCITGFHAPIIEPSHIASFFE
jgi:hypothetical protein